MLINRWSDSIDCPENNLIYVGNSSDEIWITQDETHLRVGDMSDQHVINCYKFVHKNPSIYWQKVFKEELIKRGIKEIE